MMRPLIIGLIFSFSALQAQDIKDYVLKTSIEIKSIDPSDTIFSDLEPIEKAIGNARVVFLGEQDHGDAPCFLAKTRIIKYLHGHLGFEVLAFESDFFGLNRIYDQTDTINSKEILNNIYPIWTRCAQNEELFNYVDNHLNSKNPLIITGFDIRHALKYSTKNYTNEFDSILRITNIPFYSTSYHQFKPILTEIIEKEYESKIDKEQQQYFFSCLDTIQLQLAKAEFKDNAFWIQELKSLRAHAQNSFSFSWIDNTAGNIRDKQMGDNLLWLIHHKFPNKRIIVWAHNFHIAKNINQSEVKPKTPYITTGDEVYNVLKNEIYILGFDSYSGRAGRINAKRHYKIRKPKNECFENWIKTKEYKYAFTDFSKFPNRDSISNKYFKMKGLSHFEASANWLNMFDGVFYIQDMYPCDKKDTTN